MAGVWSLLNTPEDLYGREACQCNRTPQESYQRIFEHLKEILPDASDKQIQKMIG
ncbi:AlkZ-related protein [Segatella copri]